MGRGMEKRLYNDMQWVLYPITTLEIHNRGPTSNIALDQSQSTPYATEEAAERCRGHRFIAKVDSKWWL